MDKFIKNIILCAKFFVLISVLVSSVEAISAKTNNPPQKQVKLYIKNSLTNINNIINYFLFHCR